MKTYDYRIGHHCFDPDDYYGWIDEDFAEEEVSADDEDDGGGGEWGVYPQ